MFENEIAEETGTGVLEENQGAIIQAREIIEESTKMASTDESKEADRENVVELSSLEVEGKQLLEEVLQEEEGIGEMVAGLGEEDGNLEFELMEDEEEVAGLDQEISADENGMEIEEAFPTVEEVDVVGEKENMTSKKKGGKITAAAMGGNAKKRLVQSLVSPRKKVMAKHGHKTGDKGPVPNKKPSLKPKPVLD